MKLLSTRMVRPRGGFSLAELMVVIVIIGLLATLVVPNVIGALTKGQTGKMKADITQLMNAVDQFYLDRSRYPNSLEELVMSDGTNPPYIRGGVPLDPWKKPYKFEPPMGGQGYRIFSYGRDGQPGGEGEDRDYDNTMLQE
jgi:general secretion pathway protein G